MTWTDRRVEATSLPQAQAILRRAGFVVDEGSGRIVGGGADDLRHRVAAPGPLRCVSCGYHLDGVVVRDAVVECPECGHGQVVLAYVPGVGYDAIEQSLGRMPPPRVQAGRLVLWVIVSLLAMVGAFVVFALLVAILMGSA